MDCKIDTEIVAIYSSSTSSISACDCADVNNHCSVLKTTKQHLQELSQELSPICKYQVQIFCFGQVFVLYFLICISTPCNKTKLFFFYFVILPASQQLSKPRSRSLLTSVPCIFLSLKQLLFPYSSL